MAGSILAFICAEEKVINLYTWRGLILRMSPSENVLTETLRSGDCLCGSF